MKGKIWENGRQCKIGKSSFCKLTSSSFCIWYIQTQFFCLLSRHIIFYSTNSFTMKFYSFTFAFSKYFQYCFEWQSSISWWCWSWFRSSTSFWSSWIHWWCWLFLISLSCRDQTWNCHNGWFIFIDTFGLYHINFSLLFGPLLTVDTYLSIYVSPSSWGGNQLSTDLN